MSYYYYDCETNDEHVEICSAAGVKHYPALAFFSMAGNNHQLARQKPKHVTRYSGNWQIGDAVLDWVRTMSTLAQWHRAGWGKRIRNALSLFGNSADKNKVPEPLPLGVPKTIANEVELQKLRRTMNETHTLAVRSSSLVDALLFPVIDKVGDAAVISENGKNYTDVYNMLHQRNAWKTDKIFDEIIRTCVADIALDYCTRLSTHYMEVWMEAWPLHKTITEEAFDEFQLQLHADLAASEPYCAIMDNCTVSNFAEQKCQPPTCPFSDRTVCRYLTACLKDQIQHEYAEALELLPHQQELNKQKQKQQRKQQKGSGGFSWGL